MQRPSLPAETRIESAHLRVADLEGLEAFYQEVLGFTVLGDDGVTVTLGTDEGPPMLTLEAAPGAPARPEGATGLYHMAFLLPSRAALGAMLIRVREIGYTFQGFADHRVSEALYLADPEGNGIELYADRPRESWAWENRDLLMSTDPLDVVGLLEAGRRAALRLPRGTRLGHLHLEVSSLRTAEEFYVDRLGFDVTTRRYPGAIFLSAGGYHHHLGLNVWKGEGAAPPPAGSLGLTGFTLAVPDAGVRRLILGGVDHGELVDPDELVLRLENGR